MKTVSILRDNLLSGLNAIFSSHDHAIRKHLQAVELVSATIADLEKFLTEEKLEDNEAEVEFFKIVKPQFDGLLLMHLRLLKIEPKIPESQQDKRRFYRAELKRVKRWLRRNQDFYQYMMAGDTYNDTYYFLRTEEPDPKFYEEYGHRYDARFNTRMSRKAARLKGCQLLQDHLLAALLDVSDARAGKEAAETTVYTWQSPKVYLAELIYALYATSVFGQVELQSLAKFVCSCFGTRFANVYKVFEEIRLRKKNRTTFLDFLKHNLNRQMDQDDEFSL